MHPEEANHRFTSFLKTQIFRAGDGVQLMLDFETEVEVLKQYITANERGGWKQYFMAQGIESILSRAGSMDIIEAMLQHVGYKRAQVYNIMKQIRDIMRIQGFVDSRRGEDSVSRTIETLRQTFAA